METESSYDPESTKTVSPDFAAVSPRLSFSNTLPPGNLPGLVGHDNVRAGDRVDELIGL